MNKKEWFLYIVGGIYLHYGLMTAHPWAMLFGCGIMLLGYLRKEGQ